MGNSGSTSNIQVVNDSSWLTWYCALGSSTRPNLEDLKSTHRDLAKPIHEIEPTSVQDLKTKVAAVTNNFFTAVGYDKVEQNEPLEWKEKHLGWVTCSTAEVTKIDEVKVHTLFMDPSTSYQLEKWLAKPYNGNVVNQHYYYYIVKPKAAQTLR